MNANINRREFLTTATATGLGLWAAGRLEAAPGFKTILHKGVFMEPKEPDMRRIKEAGFEGLEAIFRGKIPSPEEAAKMRELAEKIGLRIYSVYPGWAEFNSGDPRKVEASVARVADTLRAAKAAGAGTVLLIPGRLDPKKIPTPQPWEFEIEMDGTEGHVKKVVAGDNSKFEAYIKAQNHATDASRAAIKKLIPLAEELKVILNLENVWNNLWVTPELFKAWVSSFKHPLVRCNYDIGNHVKYLRPAEEWIRTLGSLIARIHLKDYLLAPDKRSGRFVFMREGSVNWPGVRQAIEDIGYSGWVTLCQPVVEGKTLPWEEYNRRIDLCIAGK